MTTTTAGEVYLIVNKYTQENLQILWQGWVRRVPMHDEWVSIGNKRYRVGVIVTHVETSRVSIEVF